MKILIIQPYRLGDVLQTTPVLQALKMKYNDVEIDFVVDSSCAGAIRGNPFVSRLIVLPRRSIQENGGKNAMAGFRELYAFMGEILQTRYDLAINYNFDSIGGIILKECMALDKRGVIFRNGRIEMDDPWTKYLFAIISNRQYSLINITDIFRLMAGVQDFRAPLYLKAKANKAVIKARFLDFPPGKKTVALQGFASSMERSLSPVQNMELIKKLTKKYNVVLIGGAGEERYMPGLKDDENFRNLTGKTSLDELAGVIKNSDLLITPDTFAMHAGAAMGVRTLAMFKAGAWPFETAPYAAGVRIIYAPESCAPCDKPGTCANKRCGSGMTPQNIMLAAESVLGDAEGEAAAGVEILESKRDNFLYFDAGHLEKIIELISANSLINSGKTPIIPVKRELRGAVRALTCGFRALEADLKRDSVYTRAG